MYSAPTAAIPRLPPAAPVAMPGGAPHPSSRVRPAPTRQDFAALRVLILEDDAPQAQLLRAVLKGYGVVVVSDAADGAGGLALLGGAVCDFDIVISDLKMAGMDGIEFMRRAAL
ncbi:response regulator [Janthinobacterium sp.]|uniref:response regulator n=1 Tax=Janthinobacterium sp. TaxID=1871054 RepID=UPI00293D439E|nr:response regulator [Janthinobacterium sp.]